MSIIDTTDSLTRRSTRIATYFGIWTIIAVIAATTAFIALRGDGLVDFWSIQQPMLLYYYIWGAAGLLVYRVVYWVTDSGRWVGGALILLAIFSLVTFTMPFIVHYENWRDWLYGSRAVGFHLLGTIVFLLILTTSSGIALYRKNIQRERQIGDARLRTATLENRLSLAQMDAMKMQINPHFLFNALNSIASLVENSANVQAYETIEMLGRLLRTSLEQSSDRLIPLGQELDFIQQYIEIEKVRFGDRIRYTSKISPECAAAVIPGLIVQPLVENSIKHAVGKVNRPVQIELNASVDNENRLRLQVTDDGPGIRSADELDAGHGISNVSERLRLLHGADACLTIAERDTGFSATLSMPLRTDSD